MNILHKHSFIVINQSNPSSKQLYAEHLKHILQHLCVGHSF